MLVIALDNIVWFRRRYYQTQIVDAAAAAAAPTAAAVDAAAGVGAAAADARRVTGTGASLNGDRFGAVAELIYDDACLMPVASTVSPTLRTIVVSVQKGSGVVR